MSAPSPRGSSTVLGAPSPSALRLTARMLCVRIAVEAAPGERVEVVSGECA
jgi:hypothetical protein